MLFLLAMEPLHRLFRRAQDSGLLGSLSRGSNSFRLSLYADVAATFIKPTQQDLEVTLSILQIFVEAPGLCTSMNKTECYPIQCGNINLDFLSDRNLAISSFPCKYMGLPLHFKKPNRAMLQPVIQKLGDRLSGWKRNFFSYLGRELLVKSVPSWPCPHSSSLYLKFQSGLMLKWTNTEEVFFGREGDLSMSVEGIVLSTDIVA
jgi:hypothetical protein